MAILLETRSISLIIVRRNKKLNVKACLSIGTRRILLTPILMLTSAFVASFLPEKVRLVSEHSQGGDYITRSFYLKERDTGETRTVTQFHFLVWPEDTPSCDVKTLLEFRR